MAIPAQGRESYLYPLWQCPLLNDPQGSNTFERVLARLAKLGPWSRYRFFMTHCQALEGFTPLQALNEGEVRGLLAVAEAWAQGEQGGAYAAR